MSNISELLPGEGTLDRAKEALRRCALLIGFHADLDPLILYDARGATEETYWRHVWIFCTRIALDISEADIARAMTAVMMDLGLRVEPGSEPQPVKAKRETPDSFKKRMSAWKLRNSAIHHDTIANACHHIQDLCDASPDASAEIEWLCEQVVEHFVRNRAMRQRLDAARAKLKEERKRTRARV